MSSSNRTKSRGSLGKLGAANWGSRAEWRLRNSQLYVAIMTLLNYDHVNVVYDKNLRLATYPKANWAPRIGIASRSIPEPFSAPSSVSITA